MPNIMTIVGLALACGVLAPAHLEARQRVAAAPVAPADSRAAALARGWTALAAGRWDAAVRGAEAILKRAPWDHQALGLKIAGLSSGRGAAAGLDFYETWLAGPSAEEDAFLLQPVAVAVLNDLAGGSLAHVAVQSLQLLVAIDNPGARARLAALAAGPPANPLAEAALGAAGEAGAAARLRQTLAARAGQDRSALIKTLADGGGGHPDQVGTVLLPLLTDSVPVNRAAAAEAAGVLSIRAAVPALRTLTADPVALVRIQAAVALIRLGESDPAVSVEALLADPISDVRLLAAEGLGKDRAGVWTAAVRPLLQDPNPVTRIRAAGLLLRAGSAEEEALRMLTSSSEDSNPVVRQLAARALDGPAVQGALPVLRRLLRDADPVVRLNAARALLRRIGAGPGAA